MVGMTTSAPRRRSRLPLVAAVVVIALVAALIGGEVYARNRVSQCLATQFQNDLGSKVDVDLGWQPVLLSLVTKSFSSVDISSDDSRFGPAQDMQVRATVNDVDLETSETSGGAIGSSTADVVWSTDGILATLQQQGIGSVVSGVTADPGAGTLRFDIVGGLAALTVAPTVSGDTIDVRTTDASILGIGIPTDLADSVVGILTDSLTTFPLGMTPDTLTVTDTGIELTLSGGQYQIPPAQADSGEQALSC